MHSLHVLLCLSLTIAADTRMLKYWVPKLFYPDRMERDKSGSHKQYRGG